MIYKNDPRYALGSYFSVSFLNILTRQSSKLAGSPKSEASEIKLRTSETIFAVVRLD